MEKCEAPPKIKVKVFELMPDWASFKEHYQAFMPLLKMAVQPNLTRDDLKDIPWPGIIPRPPVCFKCGEPGEVINIRLASDPIGFDMDLDILAGCPKGRPRPLPWVIGPGHPPIVDPDHFQGYLCLSGFPHVYYQYLKEDL